MQEDIGWPWSWTVSVLGSGVVGVGSVCYRVRGLGYV